MATSSGGFTFLCPPPLQTFPWAGIGAFTFRSDISSSIFNISYIFSIMLFVAYIVGWLFIVFLGWAMAYIVMFLDWLAA